MKTLLTIEELRAFVPLLRELFVHVERVKSTAPAGLSIKRLQVPSAVTESLAALILNSGILGVTLTVTPSRSGGDLEAQTATGVPAKLEVKGTTAAAFQQFGKKDIECDVLVWIHFDDYFWNPSKELISIYLLAKPGTVITKPTKLELGQLLARADDANQRVLLTTVDVGKLLGGHQGAGPNVP